MSVKRRVLHLCGHVVAYVFWDEAMARQGVRLMGREVCSRCYDAADTSRPPKARGETPPGPGVAGGR